MQSMKKKDISTPISFGSNNIASPWMLHTFDIPSSMSRFRFIKECLVLILQTKYIFNQTQTRISRLCFIVDIHLHSPHSFSGFYGEFFDNKMYGKLFCHVVKFKTNLCRFQEDELQNLSWKHSRKLKKSRDIGCQHKYFNHQKHTPQSW